MSIVLIMTFLNATLIFGALAAIIPIVLHLIARREPRKVVFPSIRFLTKRFDSNRSRLRVRRWWLLALRIAAVAALALALARPAIHQSLSVTWLTIGLVAAAGMALLIMASVAVSRNQSRGMSLALAAGAVIAILAAVFWGSYTYATGPAPAIDLAQPVALAIVLDNSPTSAWRHSDDDRIHQMQDIATWMIARLPRTSRIAVIDRSAGPAAFSLDASGAVSKMEQLRPLQVAQPLASRIDAAARLVRTSDLENRQVLVLTDLAESTWDDSIAEAGLADTVSQTPPVSFTVFDLGDFEGTNRSLTIPTLADSTPPRGVPVAMTTTLRVQSSLQSESNPSETSVAVELQMYESDPSLPVVRDGKVVYPNLSSADRTSASVADGGSSELLMTIPALDVGTHHGRIRLTGEDPLQLDDVRYFSLQVLPPSSVLLVSDNDDEARIIRQAITASAVPADDQNAEFLVERIGYADLEVARLRDFQVIVLLDPSNQVIGDSALLQFVQSGGGVLVCLGPNAGEGAVDSPWLPKLVRRWRVPDQGTFFQVTAASNPVTEPIASDTPWSDFRVQQYWQVEPRENDSVLIRYAGSDHPALVERFAGEVDGNGQRGAGRVLTLTTPIPALAKLTRPWNDLFGTDPWPAWLLVRQAIEVLSGRGEQPMMTIVGQPQLIQLLSGRFESDSTTAPKRLQLFPPDGGLPVPMEIAEGAQQVAVGDVPEAGVYWLRGDQPSGGFSANMADDAISLDRIGPDQLDAIFGPDRYGLATSREEIELAENKAAGRVSLYSPAMLLALLVFLLEQILGNRFYRTS